MNHPSIRRLLFLLGFLLVFGVSVVAIHTSFTSEVGGANDFYPRWRGSQLFWQDGIDPYSDMASAAIQRGIRGRLSRPDEDQLLFVYPFYTSFLLLPTLWIPYNWAQAIWMTMLLFALVGGVAIILRLVGWREMGLWLLGGTLLWTAVYYNSARTLLLGQFAGLIFLLLMGMLLALQRERDVLAGFLLAWTTIKPQMVFLAIPALLIWAVGRRRWRFIISAGGMMSVLLGLSFLILPEWLSGFWRQLTSYPDYTFTGSPLWVITGYYWPGLGKPAEIVLIILLLAWMAWEWRRLPRVTAVSFPFLRIISLTLLVTNLILIRTATTNYIVLYLPLFMALHALARRRRWGETAVAVFYLLSTVATWWLFLATVQGNLEHPIMYLPLPLLLLPLLLFWRGAGKEKGATGNPATPVN